MCKDKILVTGGAGYIGSHTIIDLVDNGCEVISIDNFVNSDPTVLSFIAKILGKEVKNYNIDLLDEHEVERVFTENQDIKGVIHFAALKAVGESVEKPLEYFDNNLGSLLNILKSMAKNQVENIIFSSSCTVYGIPEKYPVTEETPMQPAASPYGRTKQIGEMIIEDSIHTIGQGILLRYFNPAGAHPSIEIGELPINKAANLVPAITETAAGYRDEMTVFGDDYNTRDGSCIRDYIHIMDLAHAHTLAMKYLLKGKQEKPLDVFNLGNGAGYTVLEVINAFEEVNKIKLNYKIGPRRPGDIPAIYADSTKAKNMLGWEPKYGINDIVLSAWEWEKKRRANF
jgi:UDP-glucose 4-epimerase